jgi:transposase
VGKKVKGKKRHFLFDTVGLLLHALVHPADILDRDGGYQSPIFAKGHKKAMPELATEIIKRSDAAKGFEVLPRRWVVERKFAWLGRCRTLTKDFENLSRNALAFLKLASIRLMLRRLCSNRRTYRTDPQPYFKKDHFSGGRPVWQSTHLRAIWVLCLRAEGHYAKN